MFYGLRHWCTDELLSKVSTDSIWQIAFECNNDFPRFSFLRRLKVHEIHDLLISNTCSFTVEVILIYAAFITTWWACKSCEKILKTSFHATHRGNSNKILYVSSTSWNVYFEGFILCWFYFRRLAIATATATYVQPLLQCICLHVSYNCYERYCVTAFAMGTVIRPHDAYGSFNKHNIIITYVWIYFVLKSMLSIVNYCGYCSFT